MEELGYARGGCLVKPCVRFGEVLEPLEVARVCGWGGGERLRVRRLLRALLVARLREELGVLLEDLEVFLQRARDFSEVDRWGSVRG